MKRPFAHWPLSLILLGLSPCVLAQAANDNAAPALGTCFKPSPLASQSSSDPAKTPVSVSARRLSGEGTGQITYEGDVKVNQGSRSLSAEKAVLNRNKKWVKASGNIQYQDTQLAMTAADLEADMTNRTLDLDDASYRLQAMPGRGTAAHISTNDQRTVVLDNASFTTCPPEHTSWLLSADRIVLDTESEWGDAYGSVIRLGGVPVLYVPYITFPLSNRRKSGLLFPELRHSTEDGLSFAQPIYWNIAPNADATITPRYISKRGTQLQTEWRYLSEHQYDLFNIEYLPNDKRLDNNDDDRSLFAWKHKGIWNEHWRTHVDYTYVSDDNYFNDLDTEVGTMTDNRIQRSGSISYLTQNWDLKLDATRIQVFGNYPDPYRVMPRLSYEYRAHDLPSLLGFQFDSELTRFESPETNAIDATRLHMEPTLTLRKNTPAISLLAEGKFYQTFYHQTDTFDDYERSVSRSLPSLRLYGGLNFEREMDWFGKQYHQTLQPQIQYLYVPYRDQKGIAIYDTVPLQDDYKGLFRARRYAGLDRIADADQITIGATTRWLDDSNNERVRFSLGQIIYLNKSEVTAISDASREQDNKSALAMALGFANGPYSFYGELQQDVTHGETSQGELQVDYTPGDHKLLQMSYHYTPDTYALNGIANANRQEINQLGLVTSWPIIDGVNAVASHYRDMKLNRSIETMVGMEYESCCWSVQLLWYRRLNSYFGVNDDPDALDRRFDAGVELKFEFRGLSSGSSNSNEMLENSLFGNRKDYYLNN